MDRTKKSEEHFGPLAMAVARVLIASYFIASAMGLIHDMNGMARFEAMAALPAYLSWPNYGFELVAALSILVGFQTRMAVALLAIYVFWSSFIFNYSPGDHMAIGAFWRDLGTIGGLLMIFAQGTGRYSLDYYFAKNTQAEEVVEDPDVVNMADIALGDIPQNANS